MTHEGSSVTVAGIDIGGTRKGCHLVILRGREVLSCVHSGDPALLAQRCNEFEVSAVGVDSPCLWSPRGTGRVAERALARERIFSFSTPTRAHAESSLSGFYGWMFNGERVHQALAATHPLQTETRYGGGKVCFETFPHAVTCALLGTHVASAKRKRVQRRQLLEDLGVETRPLKSIDALDAALCAITAEYLLLGQTRAYGDAEGGYIFVPGGNSCEKELR
ncbi:MAG: DUF429 domain-containing protein [Rhodocyclaceae bacterium]